MKRLVSGAILSSIRFLCLILLFTGWGESSSTALSADPKTAEIHTSAELEQVKRDLGALDNYAAGGQYLEASVVAGRDLKARDIYRGYLAKASEISTELLSVGKKLDTQSRMISLQQLGALVQRLSLDNAQFKNTFRHGEEQFQTYQLMQKAITNLEEAIQYWRMANQYRRIYRSAQTDQDADREIVRLKLQTAINAIDELKVIVDTRNALNQDLVDN